MKEDEQGCFDWLVEDIVNTIEIKNAVEASRDENGKVDKWKATGLSMGLGHTSDDEMATLESFLAAEGAFDDDTAGCTDDCDDLPPMITPAMQHDDAHYIREAEYEQAKRTIRSTFRTYIWLIVIASIGIVLGWFSGVTDGSDTALTICLIALAILVSGGIYFCIQRKKVLESLDDVYAASAQSSGEKRRQRKMPHRMPLQAIEKKSRTFVRLFFLHRKSGTRMRAAFP